MTLRKTIAIASLSLATLIPAAAFAHDTGGRTPCILSQHQVRSVTPYKVDQRVGKQTYPEVRGAVVYVNAAPGLTAEWLRLELGRHVTAMRATQNGSMPDCALDVKDVQVQVDSAGAGFAVKLIAKDTNQGKEVLRRAQMLVG